MTEQYILGEMLKLVIEDSTDYSVEITKGIGGGTSNIHPAMEKGEFVTIIGSSGSEKTTVLKMANGFVKADAGDIFINGEIRI